MFPFPRLPRTWRIACVGLLASLATLETTTMTTVADEAPTRTFIYVSKAPEQQIEVFRLDVQTGGLTATSTLTVNGSPGSLATDPSRRFLFASLRTTSSLASYRIDPATGQLTLVSSVSLPPGENAAFVGTDRSGRWLLSASYAAGRVVVHRLTTDGQIESPAVQTIDTAKTAHCVAIDPTNQWAFVPHVAPNAVFQFRLDANAGQLTRQTLAAGGRENAGPRHLAFHPRLPIAFTSDESGSSITSYRFDPATGLAPWETLSTLPSDFAGKNSTAEVKVHPSGSFVWVSNRGHDSLAMFAIDEQGRLTARGQTPTEKTP
ncbi:MAG: lactonase family protein, partial [Pirellulaceae bacterium]